MSVMFVTERTIIALARFAVKHVNSELMSEKTVGYFAKILLDENHFAFYGRYNKACIPLYPNWFDMPEEELSPIQIIKLIEFYNYQNDSNEYLKSTVYKILQACKEKAYELGGFPVTHESHELKGWHEAEWGI